MTIQGFVDAVEPFQIRGWVHDKASPHRSVTVEVLLRGEPIGRVNASLYRQDLEQGGIGSGDHAFIFNFDKKLEPADVRQVNVHAYRLDGSFEILKAAAQIDAEPAAPERPVIHFEGVVADPTQHPVFVLGAARSGTSAVAQALLKLTRFSGNQEGHLLDLMAHLSVALNKFYIEKTDEHAPGKDTTVSLVPREFFQGKLNEMFIELIRQVFPGGSWIDKTPNSNMIYLAPRFLEIWPNSRFIFMKRRFLENVASRNVKFPGQGLEHHSSEWSRVMTAWLNVRDQLKGAAIEIDQRLLLRSPDQASEAIATLLGLSDVEATRVHQAFLYDHPERTSNKRTADLDIGKMGWQQEQMECFRQACAEVMASFGYSTNASYFLSGSEANGLVRI